MHANCCSQRYKQERHMKQHANGRKTNHIYSSKSFGSFRDLTLEYLFFLVITQSAYLVPDSANAAAVECKFAQDTGKKLSVALPSPITISYDTAIENFIYSTA
jgi:hypothetical protein